MDRQTFVRTFSAPVLTGAVMRRRALGSRLSTPEERSVFEILGVILGVKTCEVFLCFITVVISWLYCVDFSVASLY